MSGIDRFSVGSCGDSEYLVGAGGNHGEVLARCNVEHLHVTALARRSIGRTGTSVNVNSGLVRRQGKTNRIPDGILRVVGMECLAVQPIHGDNLAVGVGWPRRSCHIECIAIGRKHRHGGINAGWDDGSLTVQRFRAEGRNNRFWEYGVNRGVRGVQLGQNDSGGVPSVYTQPSPSATFAVP